ncbi:MAG: cysteine desulfurase CsdA [Gammaproteobacteria bacterium]|nr:cysteine desulfurase CsdA [Gammaproteobacteria bacterium]HBW82834.1 cysteine desulfurase CsdA [Gammaproteobacteria bacterium]|tara:strand:+ start:5084 stop:6304 length:1221 start_codon:yes stop_codon:yes gene_type:complete
MSFNVEEVRAQFPALRQEVNGKPLVYLDSAATTQKPQAVIDSIVHYYQYDNANVHRAAHTLSGRATFAFEESRTLVAEFLGCPNPAQIIWVRGVTEAINLVAFSWGRSNLGAGDKVLVSGMEHHSDIVPWQLICGERGAHVIPIPVTDDGEIDLEALDSLLDERVKMVAVNHVSNALGTINPVQAIAAKAHSVGALCMVDGAQAIAHWPLDVQQLGCDFYAFSGHKLFGPTGIGVLWGLEALLEAMPPFLGGGEMIDRVSFDGTTFNRLPFKFEAGTPNIGGVIGLGAAVRWVQGLDREAAEEHEQLLLRRCDELAQSVRGLRRLGPERNRVGVFSFLLEGTHPEDLGTLLDQQGIAIRTGHHCAQPLMSRFEVPGTARASFSLYNTLDEMEALFAGLKKIQELFA